MKQRVTLTIDKGIFDQIVKMKDIPCLLCVHWSFADGCTSVGMRCELDKRKVEINDSI